MPGGLRALRRVTRGFAARPAARKVPRCQRGNGEGCISASHAPGRWWRGSACSQPNIQRKVRKGVPLLTESQREQSGALIAAEGKAAQLRTRRQARQLFTCRQAIAVHVQAGEWQRKCVEGSARWHELGLEGD
eukprot:INCI6164.4.p3 GENE.INCI6164.4~~INCI6164.4.p3  ORF type:complete len:133 (+),score=4.01 INCI6164.4:266-664(+)